MIDLQYKLGRILRWRHAVGLGEAIRFEVAWSARVAEVSARVPGFPAPFVIRRGDSDISVFETVFVERELDVHLPTTLSAIVDGGANIGLTTAYYAHRYPAAKVVAVEPGRENCVLLRRNCAAFANVLVLEAGLWSDSGYLRISNPCAASWSLRCKPAPAGAAGAVPAYSVGDVLDLAGADRCDLLKLDIEGAEEVLFSSGAERWLPRVDAILVETHGADADAAVRAACPESEFSSSRVGEKLLLVRKA